MSQDSGTTSFKATELDCMNPYALGEAAWNAIFAKHNGTATPATNSCDPFEANIERAAFYKLVPGVTVQSFFKECQALVQAQLDPDGRPRYSKEQVERIMDHNFPFRHLGPSELF